MRGLLLCLAFAGLAGAQTFDVVSVKSSPDGRNDPPQIGNGRVHAAHVNVKTLIRMAYLLPDFQISGAPNWVETETYDVDAKSDGAASAEQTRAMLRALLADRFHLKVRMDSKETQAYALVVANGKSTKLTPADSTGCLAEMTPANPCERMKSGAGFVMSGEKVSMPMFCKMLGALGRATIVDKTNLAGVYDFQLDLGKAGFTPTPGSASNEMEAMNAVASGLQEQLGLKLERTKTNTEILVIEHIERP